jgi:hypothetical protein
MSQTLTTRPHRHLPSRVGTIALTAALVVAAAVTVAIFAVAIRDGSQPNKPAPAVLVPQRGADFSADVCEPALIPTTC